MSADVIRAFRAGDLKNARYLIGTALMTPLGVANGKACKHPITIAVWIGLASVMMHFLGCLPTMTGPGGMLGLLMPLPALACAFLPIMFLFDWVHRPIFEEETHAALVAEDMRDPQAHYSRSAASGFYILEHDSRAIGLIAIDASPEPSDRPANNRSSKTKKGPTAETAVIRHFHVEEAYRPAGVHLDLLEYAISRALAPSLSSRPRKFMAMASTLDKYKLDVLRTAGFRPTLDVKTFGPQEWKPAIYRWKNQWFEITSEEWLARRE